MRGGKRPGAGRPLLANEKRQSMTCRVSVSTLDRIKAKAQESGTSIGRTVDTIVEEFFKNQN